MCSVGPTVVGKILFQQRDYTSLLRKSFDKTYTRGPVGREDGSREDIHIYIYFFFLSFQRRLLHSVLPKHVATEMAKDNAAEGTMANDDQMFRNLYIKRHEECR